MLKAREARAWCAATTVALVAAFAAATAGAASLPDGRGYELVSPAQKNGADVMADSSRSRAAASGDAIGFSSLGGFADAQGSGVAFDYVSERTGTQGTSGWVTHGISPRQESATLAGAFRALDSLYVGDFAPDLSCGVYRAMRPLPGIGSPADITNFYMRDDLLATGAGRYALVTDPLVVVGASSAPATLAGASADCRHVIFEFPLALTPDVPSCTFNVDCQRRLYEWADGTVRLAGVLPDGTSAASSRAGLGAGGSYTPGMVSPDGRRVFFADPTTGKVYVREDGATTVQMNASEKTVRESPQPARLWVVSGDGTRAFFITGEGLVNGDDDGQADVYMFDADAPAGQRLTLVSVDANGGGVAAAIVGASTDGHYAYFIASGQLVAGEPPVPSATGLYVWHDGTVRYIGSLAGATDVMVNGPDTGPGFNPMTARVSADGRYLLFMATGDAGLRGRGGFPGYDQGSTCTFDNNMGTSCREMYVYSADTGALACASCRPSGGTATADALVNIRTGTGASNSTTHLSHALSDDGRRVFFSTAESLVPGDSNGRSDVYEYDVPSGAVHLISGGTDPSDSYFLDASASGDDVFFTTRQRLVGWDRDDNYDVYDARVGGGLPDPVVLPPVCAGDSCQGQLVPGPVLAVPASSTYAGAGNAKGKHKHRRGARKRSHHRRCRRRARHRRGGHARCVRRRAARRARARRRAGR